MFLFLFFAAAAIQIVSASFICEQHGLLQNLQTNSTITTIVDNHKQLHRINPPIVLQRGGFHRFLNSLDYELHKVFSPSLLQTYYIHEGNDTVGYNVDVRAVFFKPALYLRGMEWFRQDGTVNDILFWGSCFSLF